MKFNLFVLRNNVHIFAGGALILEVISTDGRNYIAGEPDDFQILKTLF
jgi:hypothetical protein